MTGRERLFFILWGMAVYPSLLLFLHLAHGLDNQALEALLLYMGGLKTVYAGARGFEYWSDGMPADGGHGL